MNELVVFQKNTWKMRTMEIDGEPWFSASDVCKALEVGNPSQALSRLDADEKMTTLISNEGAATGTSQMAFVSEPGLYSLVLSSRKEEAKAFKRWVTHEVIPQIRKTGGYQLPQTYAEALRALADKAEEAERLSGEVLALSEKVEEMSPKVSYYETILNNPNTVLVTQIAQDYGMSAKRFNKLLHELGVQHKVGDQWILYSKYQGKKYVHSKTITYQKMDGSYATKLNTEWSQVGRLFLYDLLKQNGILPQIERELA